MKQSDEEMREFLEELQDALNEMSDDYEEWQFEYSYDMAQDFVTQTIDELHDFDLANPDDKYIPGCATYGLFTALIPKLAEMGYTIEDLTREIEEHIGAGPNETLH
jgi:hypothetical protein